MNRLILPSLLLTAGAVAVAVSLAQEPPAVPTQLPAEKAFQRKLAKAKADYDAAVKKAKTELKADLETAKVEATKAGDLEKAIAIRDRLAKADDVELQIRTGLARYYGTWKIEVMPQGTLIFRFDGKNATVEGNGRVVPAEVKVMPDGRLLVSHSPDTVQRYQFIDSDQQRMLMEQWFPASKDFADGSGKQQRLGIATRHLDDAGK